MRLETAPDKAREVSTDTMAARLYNSIEHELELGNYNEDQADAGEQALSTLEERFPGVRQAARSSTSPPPLSRRANRNAEHDGGGGDASGRGRRPSLHGGPGSSRPRSGGSSSSFSGRRVAERAAGVSGDDIAGTVITGLRWLLVAGIAYQVLQPKGSNAFSGILGGLGKGVRAIVDPVDPFAALGSSPSSASSQLAKINATVYPTQLTPLQPPVVPAPYGLPAPAASVSGPSTPARPNMIMAPFAPFPRLATGPLGSHVKPHLSPLAIGG